MGPTAKRQGELQEGQSWSWDISMTGGQRLSLGPQPVTRLLEPLSLSWIST